MKATKTIDTIRTFTVIGALTVVLAGLGLLLVAAAGIALVAATPLDGRRSEAGGLTTPPVIHVPLIATVA